MQSETEIKNSDFWKTRNSVDCDDGLFPEMTFAEVTIFSDNKFKQWRMPLPVLDLCEFFFEKPIKLNKIEKKTIHQYRRIYIHLLSMGTYYGPRTSN